MYLLFLTVPAFDDEYCQPFALVFNSPLLWCLITQSATNTRISIIRITLISKTTLGEPTDIFTFRPVQIFIHAAVALHLGGLILLYVVRSMGVYLNLSFTIFWF